ncbi:serine hydrolase domain-containing protein [Azospirillum sp. TSO22-1]|uniref:serine hydrolase domain-containing protein n=1 Tax=Azospirillum sp. TSO22-1 TaxID=716789 RepID=UPI000D64B668|nr:serine hydrolase domain-containing protein [Azospirillum sp. TSO22-1]
MRPTSEIEAAVRRRTRSGGCPGLVVGLWHEGRAEIVAHGVEPDAAFELGSLTKALTGVLLALMVEAGEAGLDETVGRVLAGRLPTCPAGVVTLEALATHASGLPMMPPELQTVDLEAPHPDYPMEALYRFLSGFTPPPGAGRRTVYSNLGFGLLGHCLSVRAGRPFARLLRERVLEPLGMLATGFDVATAAGHGPDGAPRPGWTLPEAMEAAGGLRGPVGDLLRLAAASVSPPDTPVGRALATAQRPRRHAGDSEERGLGWDVLRGFPPDVFVQKGGLTAGFSANLAISPARGEGVAVLANAFQCVADLTYFAFDRRFGLHPEACWEPAFLAPPRQSVARHATVTGGVPAS